LPKYINNGTPILGVCRGHQAIAVAFGAKLIQHMVHETNKSEDPYKCVHKITIDNTAFPNWKKFFYDDNDNSAKPDTITLEVNSRHHQTVRESSLPETLVTITRHNKDNHVEMIAHNELPIVGIQAHPEDIYEDDTYNFVGNIVDYLIEERKSILKD